MTPGLLRIIPQHVSNYGIKAMYQRPEVPTASRKTRRARASLGDGIKKGDVTGLQTAARGLEGCDTHRLV